MASQPSVRPIRRVPKLILKSDPSRRLKSKINGTHEYDINTALDERDKGHQTYPNAVVIDGIPVLLVVGKITRIVDSTTGVEFANAPLYLLSPAYKVVNKIGYVEF